MVIKIPDIPLEGLTLELAERIDLFDQGKESTAFTAALNFKPGGGGLIHVSGRVKAEPMLECSRCLKGFPFSVDSELDFDLAPVSSLKRSEHEHELDKGELEMEFYRGDEIDVLSVVKEHIFLALPMVPLHSSECKGLCPACGADLNKTACGCRGEGGGGNKFSVLKDMFKK